jgi:hypothetical protein
VEHSNARQGIATARALRDAGFAVAACPGPTLEEPCPVLRGRQCHLADRADVILACLPTVPEATRIFACHRARLPRTPLIVGVEPEDAPAAAHAALGH